MAGKKNVVIFVTILLLIVVVTSSGLLLKHNTSNDSDTDFSGRTIEVADNLDDGIVAVGQDSFRWMTYFGLADKCVMVDQNDMTNYLGKSFMYVGRALVDIDGGDSATLSASDTARKYFTHTNCGITDEDVATIIELHPSMMVFPASFYSDYSNDMIAIEKAGIKTLAIDNIYTFLEQDTLKLTDNIVKQVNIIAKSLNQNARGEEILSSLEYLLDDFRSLTSSITDRKSGYIGALAYNGAHGLDSSTTFYMPMALAGVDNIMSGTVSYEGSGVKTYQVASVAEKMEDDTVLFIDASGYYQNTTSDSLGVAKLFKDHAAYLVADYIWTGMNIETVFVDAYQILHYVYGDSILNESQMNEHINKVYDLFYGQHTSNRDISQFSKKTVELPSEGTTVFEDMNNFHIVWRGNPICGTVSIGSDGKLSYSE